FVTGKSFYGYSRPPPAVINRASSPNEALVGYCRIHRQSSVRQDTYSLLFALKSAAGLDDAKIVISHLHAHAIRVGYSSNVFIATCLLSSYVATASFPDACLLFDEMPDRTPITWNVMIKGYARSGNVDKAREVFEGMPQRSVESWCNMIAAYVRSGCWNSGLSLFREMVAENGEVKPDKVTLVTVLSCCVQMGCPGSLPGRSVHCFLLRNEVHMNVEIGTVLVDMYAKLGFLDYALLVFDSMKERNVATWTALICGAAQNGCNQEALSFFEMMTDEQGVEPNEMTFTGVLNACAHSGLVEQGRRYFEMIKEYGLKHRIQHYGCMVDLYGRAGLMEEAHDVIMRMELEPNSFVWGSFLSACKEHDRFDMAEKVMEQVLRVVKPETDGGIYSQMCDLYVGNDQWEDAERIRKLMVDRNVRKVRGSSSFVRSDRFDMAKKKAGPQMCEARY
ncbi:Pentatricopeptide repeat-containing protein At5g66520, partial [Linum grandiflorum]